MVVIFFQQASSTKDILITDEHLKAFEMEKHSQFIQKYAEDKSSYVKITLRPSNLHYVILINTKYIYFFLGIRYD